MYSLSDVSVFLLHLSYEDGTELAVKTDRTKKRRKRVH